MKKLAAVACIVALTMALAGCGGGGTAGQQQQEEPPNLEGAWHQVNSASDTAWMDAEITSDEISVDWVSDGGETISIYWIGSFDAPTEPGDSYSWTSEKDVEQVGNALLASSDETKDFFYENGELTFEVTALGTTTTVHMKQVD